MHWLENCYGVTRARELSRHRIDTPRRKYTPNYRSLTLHYIPRETLAFFFSLNLLKLQSRLHATCLLCFFEID